MLIFVENIYIINRNNNIFKKTPCLKDVLDRL